VLLTKRYLLSDDFSADAIKTPYKSGKSKEFYIYLSRCKEVKYQKIGNRYFKLVKTKHGIEIEDIDKSEYRKKRAKKLSHVLKKDFYDFDGKAKVYVYKKEHKGIVVLEVASETPDEKFLPFILDDISDKKRYKDIYLALYGNPFKDDKNIHKIMKKLKNMEIDDMKNVIKKDMSVDSAVRVKLYELYLRLVQDRFELLKDDQNRANKLSIYRKRLNTILDVLNKFGDNFEYELVSKVKENLMYIYKKTNIDEELNSIRVKLKSYKKCMDNECFVDFLQDEDSHITKEVEKFSHFMQKREYSIILKQLELLIKESSVEGDDVEADITIKAAVRKSIKKSYKKVNKSVKKYIDCEDDDSYSKILKKVKTLYNINNEFGFLVKNRFFHHRKRVITKLMNTLEDAIKVFKNIEVSKTMVKDAESLECLMKKFEKEQKVAIKEVKKSIKDFKKSEKFFIS